MSLIPKLICRVRFVLVSRGQKKDITGNTLNRIVTQFWFQPLTSLSLQRLALSKFATNLSDTFCTSKFGSLTWCSLCQHLKAVTVCSISLSLCIHTCSMCMCGYLLYLPIMIINKKIVSYIIGLYSLYIISSYGLFICIALVFQPYLLYQVQNTCT